MDRMTRNLSTTNHSLDNCTRVPYYIHSTGITVSYVLSYLMVLLLCIVGNGLVCLVIIKKRNMRTVTNLFILNLAISDLLVGVFCVPITLIDSLISGWPLNQLTCKMSNLVQGMSVSTSVFTLVAIAIDRFTGIVYPFHHRLRPVFAFFTIIFIWLLAFAIIFPSVISSTVKPLDAICMVQDNQIYPVFVCFEDWPRADMRQVYTTFIFINVYLAPLVLLSIMYGCIATKLSKYLHENRGHSRRRIRVIKMLIIVTALFMVSWLPLWTLMLLRDYQELDSPTIDFLSSYLFPVAHWLAFFNSAVNPIIYGFFNMNFRKGFQSAMACGSCNSFVSDMRRAYFALLPHNKVSAGNTGATNRQKVHFIRVMPRASHGIQEIVLQDMN